MNELTPAGVVRELDRHIVGQAGAKRAVAIALCTRERRKLVPESIRKEIVPRNILMIGPTGVGKTEIARRVAALVDAPFIKVEATRYTEVGYVGRDVDSIISDLAETAWMRVYERHLKEVERKAEAAADEKLSGFVCQQYGFSGRPRKARSPQQAVVHGPAWLAGEGLNPVNARRQVASLIHGRQIEDQEVEIEVPEDPEGGSGGYPYYYDDGYGDGYQEPQAGRPRTVKRKVPVREARRLLTRVEANKLLDYDRMMTEAVRQTEESGVVFIDELDKLIGPKVEVGRDISGEGVQRDLLPLLEGSTVMTRLGPVKTDYILYVAAGAFYQHKPSELIAELQGRLPIRVELSRLSREDLERILTEPAGALTRQYRALLETEGVQLEFTPDGVGEIARLAELMNERAENIGARRLNTIMEKVLEEANFLGVDLTGQVVKVDAAYVRARVDRLIKDEDLSRYIL